MATNTATFTINLDGNAYQGVVQLTNAVQKLNGDVAQSQSLFVRFGEFAYRLNNIMQLVGNTVGRVVGKLSEFGFLQVLFL